MNRSVDIERAAGSRVPIAAGACRRLAARIDRARQSLLAELKQTFAVPEKLLRLALDEADALAWQTGFPQLFFPDLAREKVRAIAAWHVRQQSLRRSPDRRLNY